MVSSLLILFFCLSPSWAFLTLSLYLEAKCPAVFSDRPASSVSLGSVSLCTFSLVMLSEQEISHSIRLRSSLFTDKACSEGASSPHCTICHLRLPLLLIDSGHLHLLHFFFFFFLHPVTFISHLLVFSWTIRGAQLFTHFLQLPVILFQSSYSQQIPSKCFKAINKW